MEEKQNFPRATGFSGKILIALLFILSGILLFARNMGWITSEVFDLIVSWHSLLILLGIYAMIRRHFIGGIILFLAGVYFLIGGLSWLPENSQAMVWPLALIIAGVLFIFKPGRNKRAQWARQHTMEHRRQWMKMHQGRPGMNFESEQQQSESVDGFLRSENVWGAARHVVLDELFKGAMIRTSFGGTTIDPRHTHIAPGETYIDLDCSWGGVEIYVPSDWTVVFKCNAFFGGCDDKRWQNGNVNKENILVIRGTLSFGGLEVKDQRMKPHPIIDYPFRWIPMLVLAFILVATQVALVCGYTGNDYLPALVDGVATIGWLAAIAYLAWFVVGLVSLFQTDIIMIIVGSLLWLAGSFMICDIMVRIVGISYIPFVQTIPFRLLFGLPTLIAITLWYRLIVTKEEVQNQELDKELAAHQLTVTEQQGEPQTELIDRITVKDGSRIHLVKTDELIYIQACGDYVMLITPTGEYLKEQTMKYFETHLSPDTFVRVHRSTIVNVTQISRVELFGKETYQLLLKTGVKLKVSLSGYRLLKERLGI